MLTLLKKTYYLFPILLLTIFYSCEKDSPEDNFIQNEKNDTKNKNTKKSEVLVFDSLVFNRENQFFGANLNSNLNINRPLNSYEVINYIDEIEITFIYNSDYGMVGFMDPLTRSKEWYWNNHQLNWLDSSLQTYFYKTNLNQSEFIDAKKEIVKIEDYFTILSDSDLVKNPIFPNGSCIGGRADRYAEDPIAMGKVYAFIIETGKKGLIYIRTDQSDTASWNRNWHPFNRQAKVDIIREK